MGEVRTVAEAVFVEAALVAVAGGEPLAEAALMPPAGARPTPAMTILGRFIGPSLLA